MYETIKNKVISAFTLKRVICGVLSIIFIYFACSLIGGYLDTRANYQRTRESVERIEKQQRESLETNRSIQRSIDRSADYSREAATRIERSSQYNQQIGERINASQTSINEARNYLVRNAELFDRVERANRQRQENNQTLTNATEPIPNTGSGCDNRSSNSSMTER